MATAVQLTEAVRQLLRLVELGGSWNGEQFEAVRQARIAIGDLPADPATEEAEETVEATNPGE